MELNQEYTQNYQVTEVHHNFFIDGFNDVNPLHSDEDFARGKGFSGKVMHGNILNGFISHFIGCCLGTPDVIIHSQEIKFKNPVFLNDSLKLNVKIIEVYESVKTYQMKYVFLNEAGKKVAVGKFQIGLIPDK